MLNNVFIMALHGMTVDGENVAILPVACGMAKQEN